MDEQEWTRTRDAAGMVRCWMRHWAGPEAELTATLQRYYLACCRRIWPLLVADPVRNLVAVAERFAAGSATGDDLGRASMDHECGFTVVVRFADEYPEYQACLDDWLARMSAIPAPVLKKLTASFPPDTDKSPRALLLDAARFAFDSATLQRAHCWDGMSRSYGHFLSAHLFRELVSRWPPEPAPPGRRPDSDRSI